ncbi:MAG: hypothetical protein ACXQT2_01245 [Methanotrichaceae archaeon]
MKIRIEIEDRGMKSAHEFETPGSVSRDRVIDFLTAAGVFTDQETAVPGPSLPGYETGQTLRDKMETFIRYEFPDTWFSSHELRERYETVLDDVKLSTVSTYLSRMQKEGVLERRGNRNQRRYRLMIDNRYPEMEHSDAIAGDQRRSAAGRW